jgi:hypothetical protein
LAPGEQWNGLIYTKQRSASIGQVKYLNV